VEEITVDDPSQYTLTLLSDGTAAINADCNAASTTYQLDGQSITIDEPMAMTMAFCGEDSLSDEFVRQVGVAAITFMDGEDLMIDLFADGGTMRFANGGPAEAE
jgi:heat shock protein HslJ